MSYCRGPSFCVSASFEQSRQTIEGGPHEDIGLGRPKDAWLLDDVGLMVHAFVVKRWKTDLLQDGTLCGRSFRVFDESNLGAERKRPT